MRKTSVSKFLYSVLALIFLLSYYARADSQDSQLTKTVAILQAQLQDFKQNAFAIGTIQQAFVNEAEFQKQMGKGWVLCDGRNVVGSKWHKLGFGSNIPDCRGRFLRSFGSAAAPLKESQEQATAVGELKAAASTILTSPLSVTVEGSTSFANWTGDLYGVASEHAGTVPPNPYQGVETWNNTQVGRDGPYWDRMFAHSHALKATGSATGGAWTTSVNVTSSSTETRPINVTVNTFVRID